MEHDDLDLALSAPLVALARGYISTSRAPRLLRTDPCPATYLGPGVRGRLQIVVPGSVFGHPTVGGDDNQFLPVFEVQKRDRPLSSGSAPGREQKSQTFQTIVNKLDRRDLGVSIYPVGDAVHRVA
jgi:hypothetical protein